MKKYIIRIFFIALAIFIFNTKINYAGTISGYAKEVNDSGEEKAIEDIIVELWDDDDNHYTPDVKTDSQGKYEFTDVPEGEYVIKFSWGSLENNIDIDTITLSDVPKVQNIIKYNAQDYELDYFDYDEDEVEISDEEKEQEMNEYFSTIQYNNSAIFKAIDMTVEPQNLEQFKKYAKILSEQTSMTGESTNTYSLDDENGEISGPDLVLKEKEEFNLEQLFYITGMRVTAQTGETISLKTGAISNPEPLLDYKEQKDLYGSTVELEYSLTIYNYSKLDINILNNLTIGCFLPAGFEYTGSQNYISEGQNVINNEEYLDESKFNIEMITKDNINTIDSYFTIDSQLEKTKIYDEIEKNNKNMLLIKLNFDEINEFGNAGFVSIKFLANKLLNGLDRDAYQGTTEIFQYSDTTSRRLKIQGTKNMAAGDLEESQNDMSITVNSAAVVPPTGGDERKIYIFYLIGICLIIAKILICRLRKN